MNKIFSKKNSTLTIALVVMMTLAILAAAAPLSNAQNLLNHTTYIYVVAEPNPVGVSQTTYISYFLPDVPPAQFPTVAPRYGTWDGITVTVTKPDGTVQTFANISTSYAGSGTISYVPSLVGTYTIMASFPGQTITTGSSRGQYYGPSTSPIATFNVTTQPLPPPISYPLPTNYWTYPIEGQNQAWNIYSGNWLAGNFPNASMTSPWNPWTVGPYSAHILWSQTWVPGGLVGGNYQSQLYYSGRWPGGSNQYFCPFIANGIMYTNLPVYYLNSSGTAQPAGFEAMNLATGQVIWKNTATNDAINYLQVLDFGQSTMAQGTYQLLWSTSGSSWRTYDPLTGNLLQTIANVTSGGKVTFGPNGEFMIYFVNANGWMAAWNSTIFEGAVAQQVGWTYNPIYSPNTVYEVCQGTYNFPLGFQWNITIPKQSGISITNGVLPNDLIIASTSIAATNSTSTALQQIAFSIKPNQYTSIGPNSQGLGAIQNNTGNQVAQVLWGPINRTTYVDNGGYERIETIAYANNGIPVFVMYSREKLQMVAYNAYTGAYMYTTQPFENAFAMFTGESNNIQAADGKLFAGDYDGTMHCYDLATGNLLWEYYVGNAGLNTPYGTWVIDGSYSYYDIAGGMVIMGANEHSPNNPTWLGGQIWAVNETSGQLIWKITSFQDETQPIAAVENQIIYLNYYDGKLYDIGRGPSATTVSAPENVQPLNSPVLIKGTVTDQSIGAIGTPAISDSSMTPWMEYLYMQKPKPTNATGVQVTLTTLDPNNNIETIGTVTSDSNGNYGISWTPPVPGLYKITATFSGTNSYWGSDSTTYLIVGKAATSQASANPTATTAPTTSPTSTPTQTVSPSPSQAPQPTSGTPIMTYIAIAAAVVIIALIATAVVLRRRK